MWYVARFGTIGTILKNVKNIHRGVLVLVKLQAGLHLSVIHAYFQLQACLSKYELLVDTRS